ncbi:nuclear receptor 2C2-associated protein [Hyalella azteca]|uniref:Nuclear receptor 2C2-associated protein n=1 Tax=Hyalella azteca TaxID=294128 RepID=A0A8B7NFH4_HYAAZ|nr:nuclear receptor 2C2-associated protein [Hyalella azteca]
MMTSLIPSSECRVSSVLQRNVKEVGKQFMFDNNPSTCWNSDQGSPQWVAFKWTEKVIPISILATFQGGFCGGRDTAIQVWNDDTEKWAELCPWYLEDSGSEQQLLLPAGVLTSRLRLFFPSSTDFFGRIIMYKLEVSGSKS